MPIKAFQGFRTFSDQQIQKSKILAYTVALSCKAHLCKQQGSLGVGSVCSSRIYSGEASQFE
jgi:hypothetical protein